MQPTEETPPISELPHRGDGSGFRAEGTDQVIWMGKIRAEITGKREERERAKGAKGGTGRRVLKTDRAEAHLEKEERKVEEGR